MRQSKNRLEPWQVVSGFASGVVAGAKFQARVGWQAGDRAGDAALTRSPAIMRPSVFGLGTQALH